MSVKKIKVAKKSVNLQEEIPNLFERAKAWLEEHPFPVLGAIVVLLVVAIAFWGVNSYRNSKENSARAAYAQVMKNWPGEEASDPKAMETVATALEKYVAEHQGTKSALNGRLDLAQAYFQMHRYEDALKWSKGVLDEVSPDSELKPLAAYQVAQTFHALGKTEEALEQWKALKSMGMPGLDREISWYMAKLYAGKGDLSKSIEQYESALKDSGMYPPTAQLQDELSAIKLKTASSSRAPKSAGAHEESKG